MIGIPHKRLSISATELLWKIYSAAQAAIRNNPNQFAERTREGSELVIRENWLKASRQAVRFSHSRGVSYG